jgi:hypothetical protein
MCVTVFVIQQTASFEMPTLTEWSLGKSIEFVGGRLSPGIESSQHNQLEISCVKVVDGGGSKKGRG